MENKNYIPDELYHKILDSMPILCVDGMVIKDGEVLLLLRGNEPEKNRWWFPGGRVLKGETLEDAILRKVKEETGLTCKVTSTLDITQTMFPKGINNKTTHTVNICFILETDGKNFKLDKEHKGYGWFNSAPAESHDTIKYIFEKLKG